MWERSLVGAVLLVGALGAKPAQGQTVDEGTRAAARDLGYAGVESYQQGEYATAEQKLDKAYRVLKAPSLGLWSARARVKLGRLVEAAERYREVMRPSSTSGDQEVQKRAQVEAENELAALTPRLAGVTVVLDGAEAADVTVKIDGALIATELVGENRPVNPGKRRVEAQRGADHAVAEVTIGEGETKRVVLKFTPQAAGAPSSGASEPPAELAPPAPQASADDKSSRAPRTLAWVALGVGGAGLAAGAITGVLALGKRSDMKDSAGCDIDRNECLASERSTVDSYQTLRMVSGVSLIAGGVLAATGVTLLLTTSASPKRVSLDVGPASLSLRGKF